MEYAVIDPKESTRSSLISSRERYRVFLTQNIPLAGANQSIISQYRVSNYVGFSNIFLPLDEKEKGYG